MSSVWYWLILIKYDVVKRRVAVVEAGPGTLVRTDGGSRDNRNNTVSVMLLFVVHTLLACFSSDYLLLPALSCTHTHGIIIILEMYFSFIRSNFFH